MSQFVIEFGSERVRPIVAGIALCVPSPHNISVDEAGSELHYFASEGGLTQVVADLEAGTAASAVIRCPDERIRYALICSPRHNNSGLSKWMGTIEVTAEDWSFVWDALLATPDLLFVCVGDPEGVELSNDQISVDAFPWKQWPLLIGAVRQNDSHEWIMWRREGTESVEPEVSKR